MRAFLLPANIPDFRGAKGIYIILLTVWGIPPVTNHAPQLFCPPHEDFYEYYRENMVYSTAKPNAVHNALAKLEEEGKIKAVITQNIDGLHQAAGSKNVFELHGNVHRNYCLNCEKFFGLDYVLAADGVPKCSCGGVVKPDVVLYEEPLNDDVWYGAFAEVRRADTLIIAGSSLTVYPAAGLVDLFNGKNLCIINAQSTPYDGRATYLSHEDVVTEFNALLK